MITAMLLIMAAITAKGQGVSQINSSSKNTHNMILKRPATNSQQDVLNKANIKELLEFERFCRDNALWDEMHKCFADDSYVNISWYRGTGHGFVDASSKNPTRAPHKIYNTETWLNGDKAVSIMMTTISMRMQIDGVPVELSSDAKLIFRTQKIDGQWYIAGFESIYEQDRIIPVLPNSKINIPAEEISKYRQSYACMIYMMRRNGTAIDENLPGIDRPDLVEELYRRTDEWLSARSADNKSFNKAHNMTVTDYEAINNLIVAERLYRVSHRDEELAKCYAADAQIHTSWQSGGVNTFVGQTSAETVEELPIVNRCGGALIYQNGDKAFVEYPTTTTRGVYVNGAEAVLTSYMRLLYRVEKRNGEWKITSMTSINESDELAPIIPGQDLKVNPDDVKGLRLSYRWLACTRQLTGGSISQDLPGTDRPAEVKRIYDTELSWLNH